MPVNQTPTVVLGSVPLITNAVQPKVLSVCQAPTAVAAASVALITSAKAKINLAKVGPGILLLKLGCKNVQL